MASRKTRNTGYIRDRVGWRTLATTTQTNEEVNHEYAR